MGEAVDFTTVVLPFLAALPLWGFGRICFQHNRRVISLAAEPLETVPTCSDRAFCDHPTPGLEVIWSHRTSQPFKRKRDLDRRIFL